jgi:hypothetical protein
MRITPTSMFPPMHIARAYGVSHAARPSFSSAAAPSSQSAQGLVAGNVTEPVNFDATPAARSSSALSPGVFQMYTRAADRIEAAVAIQIGRTIDVKG